MAITTHYEQDWSAGTFNVTGTPDSGDGNYPNTTYREEVKTVDAAGPSGERIIDSDDYGTSALDEQVTEFDARGNNDGEGLFYEIKVKFSSDAESELGDFAVPFNVGVNGVSSGQRFLQFRVALTSGELYIWIRGDGEEITSASLSADDQWHTLKAQVVPSSDNGDSQQDGIVRVWLDDALVYETLTSWAWVPEFSQPLFHLNYVYFGHFGILPSAGARIYHGEEDDPITSQIFGEDGHIAGLTHVHLINLDGTERTLSDEQYEGSVFIGGNLFVTGSMVLGALGSGQIQLAEVALSSAELLALRATPKTLVAAPGAGKLLEFIGAVLLLDATATAYVETADNLAIRYTNGSGTKVSEDIEATGFIDQTADTLIVAKPAASAAITKTAAENQPLVLHNIGDGEYTTGTGTLRAKVSYRVWSTGW